MQLLTIIIFLFLGIYSGLVIWLCFGWLSIPISNQFLNKKNTIATIIVVARNEAENITKLLQSIEKQTYTNELYEVILVDDNSSDNTLELANQFKNKSLLQLNILRLPEIENQLSRKKAAITWAISQAKGSLILCTDGDCVVPSQWIENFVKTYESTGCKFISGPVTFFETSFFSKLQIVEFASLIGTGGASIQLNRPNMCNGANLAYDKASFWEVNGFKGYENMASGDDEFLMHKMAEKYPGKVVFLKDSQVIVKTNAQASLTDFVNQRKRWASKWNKYSNIKTTVLAVFIFLTNFLFIISFLLATVSTLSKLILAVLFLKIFTEILFIGLILRFLNYKKLIFLIPIVQLFYPFYVVFIALISYQNTFVWKGRIYN